MVHFVHLQNWGATGGNTPVHTPRRFAEVGSHHALESVFAVNTSCHDLLRGQSPPPHLHVWLREASYRLHLLLCRAQCVGHVEEPEGDLSNEHIH